MSAEEGFFWLQELPKYFPYARVLSFGWSGNNLRDPAYSLLADIAQSRRGLQVAYPNFLLYTPYTNNMLTAWPTDLRGAQHWRARGEAS